MATSNDSDTSNAADECSICLIPLSQPGLDIFTTACQHQFHFQCLAKNVQAQNNECPLCRTRLDSLVNILNASSTVVTPVPIENVPLQQVVPIQTTPIEQVTPIQTTPIEQVTPIQTAPIQQVTLIQTTPIQQTATIQTAPLANNTGIWGTLTKSVRNAFSWVNRGSNISVPSAEGNKNKSTWNFSNISDSTEDRIDKKAVRDLSTRIDAARQQSVAALTTFPEINATTTLEFGAQESTKESNIYGMVTLKAPSLFSNTASEKEMDELHVPIDLVCIVDQSSSMDGSNKIGLLKHTLNYIIDQMGVLDRVSIISFNTQAYDRSNGLKLMTTIKKQILRNVIEQDIRASGGTYIGSGLEMGIQLLKNRQTTNPLAAILLLTDGQDNQHHDYSTLMEALPEGVVCHTFGYGSDHKAGLLSQLAEQGHGGTFTYIDQVNAIGPSFATALGGIFTCIAKQLDIRLEFDDDYKITHTHTTYQYEPKTLPSRQITFKMTDLNADESRNLVFQLHIPKIQPSEENNSNNQIIGRVSLAYKDANTGQEIQTPSVSFTLARPNQIDPQSPLLQVNYALDIQRNRAETAHVLKQAVGEHDYKRARELIDTQLAKIRSSLSAKDPLCEQLIRDLEYQYSNQHDFQTTMTNMYMQHGQERGTYSTVTTCSASRYITSGQERYRSKFS